MLKLNVCHEESDFWSSGEVRDSSAGTLVIRGNVVQWRNESNHKILKQFTCECEPLAAVFFPYQKQIYSNDPVVAVLVTNNLLRFHTNEGQIFELVLTFIAKNIYPSSLGLIVERERLSLSRQIYSPNDQKHFMYSVSAPDGPIRPVQAVLDNLSYSDSTRECDSADPFVSSFTEVMDHDSKYIVCIWDRYVCLFDDISHCLTIHSLQMLDTMHDLLHTAEKNNCVNIGNSSASFASCQSNGGTSFAFGNRGGENSLLNDLNKSSNSGPSFFSNSTGYSSLRRRPKKQARSEPLSFSSKGDTLSSGIMFPTNIPVQNVSPRSSSPVSFAQHFPGPAGQTMKDNSLYGDFTGSFNSHLEMSNGNCNQFQLGDSSNLPAEVMLSSALVALSLNSTITTNRGDDNGKGCIFFSYFSISFSISPVGTKLLHLLSLRNHELETYAFFPEIQSHNRSGDSSILQLMCTRSSIKSLAHIYMGKQRKFLYNSDNKKRKCFSYGKFDSHIGDLLASQNEFNDCTDKTKRESENFDLIRQSYRSASMTNGFDDYIATLLLSTNGDCDLVIGLSDSVTKVDIVGSIKDDALEDLFASDFQCFDDNRKISLSSLSIAKSSCLYSTTNHFQDHIDHNGDLLYQRPPQQRPQVMLLLANDQFVGGRQMHNLFNFSLPCWSFLHRYSFVDMSLPSLNSEALDSTPRKLYSIFYEVCNALLFMFRKLTLAQEFNVFYKSRNPREGRELNCSQLFELVTATLRVLIALENQFDTEVAGAICTPILLAVIAFINSSAPPCDLTETTKQILTLAQSLVVCGCSSVGSHIQDLFNSHAEFLSNLVSAYYKIFLLSDDKSKLEIGHILFNTFHMILEDKYLSGLNSALDDAFHITCSIGDEGEIANDIGTTAVSMQMLCIKMQNESYACYYRRLTSTMKINAALADKALNLCPNIASRFPPFNIKDKVVPSALQWLHASIRLLKPIDSFVGNISSAEHMWSPFVHCVNQISQCIYHNMCFMPEMGENGNIGEEDIVANENDIMHFVCGTGLGDGSSVQSVNSFYYLTCVELSQLAMPRLTMMRCFFSDLAYRLQQMDISDYNSEKSILMKHHQCIVAAFLRCCKFAAENFDETEGNIVLNMFPLSIKLIIDMALYHTRGCLLIAGEEMTEAKEGRGVAAYIHTCFFCPLNPIGWPPNFNSESEGGGCSCICFSTDTQCCCQRGCYSSNDHLISLQWPVDILQLVGREDYIMNSSLSVLKASLKLTNIPCPIENLSKNTMIKQSFNDAHSSKKLRESEELLFTVFPHLFQLNLRDYEDGSGHDSNEFSAADLPTEIIRNSGKNSGRQTMGGFGGDVDGLKSVDRLSISRFAEDERMKEVCRLLRSSKTQVLKVERTPEATDATHRQKQQLRLLALCRRSLGLSVGRGMLTLASLDPLMAEHLPIPPLSLSGRVPPTNAIIALDTSSSAADLTLWPEFHNGVAAGLRVRGGHRGHIDGGLGKREGKSFSTSTNGISWDSGSVTRNWILYNRNNCNNDLSRAEDGDDKDSAAMENAHAGSLLAFGLLGHLSVLNRSDISDYLTKNHEPTSIAMLIGLAASKIGTADPLVSRMLCIHLPSLLFPTTGSGASFSYASYQAWSQGGNLAQMVSPLVQTAALTGLGLVHCNTGHRLMIEFLMAELITGPSTSLTYGGCSTEGGKLTECREAAALAAGWALGMVLLAKGKRHATKKDYVNTETHSNMRETPIDGFDGNNDSAPLSDLRLEDRLHQCIEGGRRDSLYESKLFSNPKAESHSSLASRSIAQSGGDDPSTRSSRSLETDFINVNITAPGAIMALTLMYLKSKNNDIAARMAVPHTHFALDNIRPDLLIFRAMSTCVILWDSGVEASTSWVRSKLPPILLQNLFEIPVRTAESKARSATAENVKEELGTITPGVSFDDREDNFEGDIDVSVVNGAKTYLSEQGRKFGASSHSLMSMSTRTCFQALICILAGNAWGLSLRFAGTSNSEAKSILLKQLRFLQSLRDGVVPPVEVIDFLCSNDSSYERILQLAKAPISGKKQTHSSKKFYNPIFQVLMQAASEKASRPTLETCITLTALSTAVVLAGSGDLDTLTILRMLRNKLDETSYGAHLGIGMAIGFLFLGQGRASLRRDPLSIGALLMSMCPRYPTRTIDNQNHLQALRHLYVLAMEERCLSTLDVDVEESVSVDVKVCLRNGTILPLKSPTLLPELSTVASIKACSNEYFMASIEFIGPGEYCPYCNPDQFLDHRDLKLSDCNMTSTRIRTSSASVHNGFTRHHADVRYLRRCSRCPQATVLYVKRKEVEKNGRDGNILQNLEKDKSVDALQMIQRLDTTAAGACSLASALSWLRDRMSLSSCPVDGTSEYQCADFFANSNPLLHSSRICRQVSLDGSHLHSLLSRSFEGKQKLKVIGAYSHQNSTIAVSVESTILRAWVRTFQRLSLPSRCRMTSQDNLISIPKILHVGDFFIESKMRVLLDAIFTHDNRNVIELFSSFLTEGRVVRQLTNRAEYQELDALFSGILVSWGIPLEFLLVPNGSNSNFQKEKIINFIDDSLQKVSGIISETECTEKRFETMITYLEAIYLNIITNLNSSEHASA